MTPFKFAQAGGERWQELADACLAQLGEVPGGANLGFIYATDRLAGDFPELLSYLQDRLPVPHWVGTLGIGICATGREYFDEGALVIMLGEFPPDSFQVFNSVNSDLENFHQTHASWYSGKEALFGVVHADPNNNRIPELVARLANKLDEGFLVGGLTSSRQQNIQVADQISEGGLSGVLFANRVNIATRLTQGCSPISKRHEITDCRDNIIVRIDNRPALDVFKEDIGESLAEDLDSVAGYIFAALPVSGSDTGDYMVRNLLGVDLENKLIAIGEAVKPGDHLLFAARDEQTAEDDLLRILNELKSSLHGAKPRGALYYSCIGRGKHLFVEKSRELRIIRDILGDIPLAGLFAGGEISHNRLYGYTGVLSLFL